MLLRCTDGQGRAGTDMDFYPVLIVARIAWRARGFTVTALAPALAVSTHSIRRHSSLPKSVIAAAFATQGFQTTVVADPPFSTRIRRLADASSIAQAARVPSKTRSVSLVIRIGSGP